MSKTRKKLNQIKMGWEKINGQDQLSTKKKLEKLIALNIKRKKTTPLQENNLAEIKKNQDAFLIREFSYPMGSVFGNVKLSEWEDISPELLAIVAGDNRFLEVDPLKLLYFDTETTGLAGGTGTVPFMLGFGFVDHNLFMVKIFVLNDLSREEEFLNEIDRFLEEHDFSATVTYNGKSFDFPLMETRYILNRRRFPLLEKPHLDFLFPARTLWKNTYESRKLGFLGDVLLGISRSDDIDASQIPTLYFAYLRNNMFSLLEKVVEHNALDLIGLSALLLLGIQYLKNHSNIQDEGERLGAAMLFEKRGDFDRSTELYEILKQCATRDDIIIKAVKRLSVIKKKKKLFEEATELWKILSGFKDHFALRELSVHYEHRKKDYYGAIEFVEQAFEEISLTDVQRKDLEKRLKRLHKKIEILENEE